MKTTSQRLAATLMLTCALAFCLLGRAQQATRPDGRPLQSYELSREVSLHGTVVKYDAVSEKLPVGAHLIVQTSSGQVDVHLGNAKVLQANHLDLIPGDNVRILGESRAVGDVTYFAARIVQKGGQAVAVRNSRGFPLTPVSTLSPAQKEALRGVR